MDVVFTVQDEGILNFCNVLERIFAHDLVERAGNTPDSAALWDFVVESTLAPIQQDIAYVNQMPQLKAGVSKARAWVRLCMEKQQLYDHMDLLLADRERLSYANAKQ